MHYFSIHDQSGRHIGFFILLADDESEARLQSGRFAVKLEEMGRATMSCRRSVRRKFPNIGAWSKTVSSCFLTKPPSELCVTNI